MKWTELTQDWNGSLARAKRRFPNLRDQDVAHFRQDRKQFEAYLAERHHLTVNEAREELEDFLFTESLNREFDQTLRK
nr:hypothetical protein [uncultured Ruegeria sp.]